MHEINPYVLDIKTMAQLVSELPASVPDISMIFCSEGGNKNQEAPKSKDIVIRPKNGGLLQRISEMNQLYDPMSYVLLFPDRQLGSLLFKI
ncbi:hypothetical protein BDF14DRAFT_1846588 [Spinellus fusiger]|nr:hypothetical protein BDF14DRAFT_1846588 [Spinellus fusiger]